jgi:hypothetical protein
LLSNVIPLFDEDRNNNFVISSCFIDTKLLHCNQTEQKTCLIPDIWYFIGIYISDQTVRAGRPRRIGPRDGEKQVGHAYRHASRRSAADDGRFEAAARREPCDRA